uniref:Cytochrome c oxidase subunit 7C, mitochondrial n=3 Tax=Equus TaxID=9789 RepID=A0A3Q2I0G5_HORSE
ETTLVWSSRSVASDYSSHNPSAPTSCRYVLNYNSHNPRRQLLCRVFRELCPISHLPFRFLHSREQGREKRRVWAGAAISSAFGLCACRRASDRVMLGHSIRRFTTSVVRRSHYEEGPGKNVPFSVENKWRLLAVMTLYFGSGFAAPFFIVRHQLLKK